MPWAVNVSPSKHGDKIDVCTPGNPGTTWIVDPSEAMDLVHGLIVAISKVQVGTGLCGNCGGTTILLRKREHDEDLYRIQCAGCGNRSEWMTEQQLRSTGARPFEVRVDGTE